MPDIVQLNPVEVARSLQQWGYLPESVEPLGETFDSPLLTQAIAAYQERYCSYLNPAVQHYHGGRDLDADGGVGPATTKLFLQPRCNCPDNLAVEEANIPDACRMEMATRFDLTDLNLDDATTRERYAASCEAWEAVIKCRFKIVPFSQTDSLHYAVAANMARSGVLADQYLATNRCDAHLRMRVNTLVNWLSTSPVGQYFQGVITHELGHFLGLSHINDQRAIMYPYARLDVWQPTQIDVAALVRLGYSEQTEPPEPPEPGPQPPGRIGVTFSAAVPAGSYSLMSETPTPSPPTGGWW